MQDDEQAIEIEEGKTGGSCEQNPVSSALKHVRKHLRCVVLAMTDIPIELRLRPAWYGHYQSAACGEVGGSVIEEPAGVIQVLQYFSTHSVLRPLA